MTRRLRTAGLLAAAALVAAAWCVGAQPRTATAAGSAITYTYAGDSITNPDNSWSWTRYLGDDTITTPGGVGISGATSAVVSNAVTPRAVDVLVIMVGTNDVRLGVSRSTTVANVQQIAATAGAQHVVVAALPPSNLTDYGSDHIDRAAGNYATARDLQADAAAHGWLYVDPFSSVRRNDNTWAINASGDGVHPTAATGEKYVGPRMAVAIRQAVEGARP